MKVEVGNATLFGAKPKLEKCPSYPVSILCLLSKKCDLAPSFLTKPILLVRAIAGGDGCLYSSFDRSSGRYGYKVS